MRNLFFLICIGLLFSCSNSTDNYYGIYAGEPAIINGIHIYPSSETIGYNDTFSVFTTLTTQLYRINGELILYATGLTYDSALTLISPDVLPDDTTKFKCDYRRVQIEIYPNQNFIQEWVFKSDSTKIWNSGYKRRTYFQATIRIDSIYLDMDTLYGGPARPVAVQEKRWYNINDFNDFKILTGPLVFSNQFFRSSNPLYIYYKQN